ncbi:hypothetical protein L208DRAFT_579700 [Tricholoma matsutake]|nr:hypothetical protein L208DRAFT_579700 [Tricholoma matsutake 945]
MIRGFLCWFSTPQATQKLLILASPSSFALTLIVIFIDSTALLALVLRSVESSQPHLVLRIGFAFSRPTLHTLYVLLEIVYIFCCHVLASPLRRQSILGSTFVDLRLRLFALPLV